MLQIFEIRFLHAGQKNFTELSPIKETRLQAHYSSFWLKINWDEGNYITVYPVTKLLPKLSSENVLLLISILHYRGKGKLHFSPCLDKHHVIKSYGEVEV